MTEKTSLSLLDALRHGRDESAWKRLFQLYNPLIKSWLLRQRIVGAEAEDLAQEILLVVYRKLPAFEHNGRTGAFRKWLRLIVVYCARDFWSSKKIRPISPGDTQFLDVLSNLEDDQSELTKKWNYDHDVFVMNKLMQDASDQVDEITWQAFSLIAIDGKSPSEVANELKIPIGSVYTAKSRVLARLRRLAQNLVD